MRRLTRQLAPGRCLIKTPWRAPTYKQLHGSARLLRADDAGSNTNNPENGRSPRVPPTTAPKAVIDIRDIRLNPTVYEQNCLERNYKAQSTYPARINFLFEQWSECQRGARRMRERANLLRRELANPSSASSGEDGALSPAQTLTDGDGNTDAHPSRMSRDELLSEARTIKERLSTIEESETKLMEEISFLAAALPNLTSPLAPRDTEPLVLSYINDDGDGIGDHAASATADSPESDRIWRSHVHIGSELGLIDFAGAATASGWGWYYLLNEGAALEQALIQYALAVVTRHGWAQVSPPSIVYSHIADACGFQPRDQNGETQIYTLGGAAVEATASTGARPELCLAGTAEIPLAGMKANTYLEDLELPMRRVAVSRSYRAEAGGRGVDTKGLFRVHEFTKVEMFAWTRPGETTTTEVFDEVVDIQTEILEPLGLRCRVLEMPSADLGASAFRKNDIEAFFPSRQAKNGGWGEITSASICTDYQTRRLATRVKIDGAIRYPWTVNGTALAVPRVLAAILENGWNEEEMTVAIPAVLRPWMGGQEKIGVKHRRK